MIKKRKDKTLQNQKLKVENEDGEVKDLLVQSDASIKMNFAKKLLWRWLGWQIIIVTFCLITYLKPSFLPQCIYQLFNNDGFLVFTIFLSVLALYLGSTKFKDKDNKQSGIEFIFLIISQSLTYASLTSKLQDVVLNNFLIIQSMQLAVILALLIIFWNANEINHLLFFRKMFWLSIILIGSEYFFTKNISINSMPGVIIYGSLMGFGTFIARSLETILDGKFSLKVWQVNIGAILVYTNLLLPSRKG